MRIIADHIRAAVMMMTDGVMPSNKVQGYVLRRLLRRSMRYARTIKLMDAFLPHLAKHVFTLYEDAYPVQKEQQAHILREIETEEQKFHQMLSKGLREIEKIPILTGTLAFQLYETYGFPWEMTEEIARERGQEVKKGEFVCVLGPSGCGKTILLYLIAFSSCMLVGFMIMKNFLPIESQEALGEPIRIEYFMNLYCTIA